MVEAFGGREATRKLFDRALADQDYRWATEIGAYLVLDLPSDDPEKDKSRLASALRAIAYCSSASNVRNWCLTQALELDGSIDLSRFRIHRFREQEILSSSAARWVPILRVLLNPEKIGSRQGSIGFDFDDGSSSGLMIRNQVAVSVPSERCNTRLSLSKEVWAKLLGGKLALSEVLIGMEGILDEDREQAINLLSAFDLETLQR